MAIALSVHQIGRKLQERWLWRHLTFSLTAGSKLGLLGPSGSGKTLLLRALAGLDPLDEGQILWGELTQGNTETEARDRPLIPSILPYYRSQAIYLHQQPAVFEGTVESNLQWVYNLAIHQQKTYNPQRIQTFLTGLNRDSDFLQCPALTLSGGERQILALLRALQLDPMLLFLDEPTASLDPKTTECVEQLIEDWMSKNPHRACIWTSHDPHQIERITDRRLEIGSA
ncbi:ABC transporter ATP-binding protein [Roseofilum casamattae]|uniref:ATP-binding cassette domain-containing protein n=1 Tax=Roseofilum casamattae BLCC-M143 TaxID=3022442 RepID=A0ABT7BZT5_9CYAN|nr:ATP-binding cassette domain-containing protein [Roseofilum casamattae]MDJ1184681.1 ATP-binding cassette domain-containing protein [Roseofilum casamattae BLCC-M143]